METIIAKYYGPSGRTILFEPDESLQSGPIDKIQDSDLATWGIGYMDLAELLKQANGKEDEDSVCIVLSDDGI